ncbi:hypothetical protein [Desulfatibacillum aliphaticivorans]|uniref:hypothetical protein n=1 Tax=Desulfatibacillum aliphaticivorans TaxID=218208 RepID=UPI00041A00EA|nr:hypothetical protein [Desulfatibacillum aliphaticivorans]
MKTVLGKTGLAALICLIAMALPCLAPAGFEPSLALDIQANMTKGAELLTIFHEDENNLYKAGAIYEKVLEKKPDFVEAVWKLAEVQYLSGMMVKGQPAEMEHYTKSLETAGKALDLDQSCVQARFYSGCAQVSLAEKASSFKALGLLKRGKADLFFVMDQGPNNRWAPLAAAVLSQVNEQAPWPLKDLDEAHRFAVKALEWDPNLTMSQLQLARVYFAKEDYEGAAREAQACLEIKQPTYIADAVVWDWPDARKILASIKERKGG